MNTIYEILLQERIIGKRSSNSRSDTYWPRLASTHLNRNSGELTSDLRYGTKNINQGEVRSIEQAISDIGIEPNIELTSPITTLKQHLDIILSADIVNDLEIISANS